uniref:Murine leukemia virus integrase C-terminal domain-containing protein n=1 Tax=Labrus bergylta TaxID=56723 RepID=A0A3Q3FQ29_9LABR
MEKVNTPFSHTALVKKPPPYEKETNAVQPGDKVFVKVFRRKWFNERREGPFEVVRSTGTAVQVKGSPTWYHLSHCVKAPTEEVPRSQNRDVESARDITSLKQIHIILLLYFFSAVI